MLPKADWKEIISRKVQKKKTFEYLTELKATHSKSRNNIKKPQLQKYLRFSDNNSKETIYLGQATRTRMINIKGKSDLQKELERDRNSRTSCKLQEEEKKRHSEL